jgi:DNA polymerase III alpha subunit (gram-positive type)
MKGDLIFFDIETSGLDPFKHDVIEFGYVIERKGVVMDEQEFSVPFDLSLASEEALEVNGWGKRQFAPRIEIGAAVAWLLLDFQDATMVVNSLQFDLTFTSVFLHRYAPADANPTPWSHRGVDLKSVTAGKLGLAPHLLTTGAIKRHFNLKQTAAHTALGDAWFNHDWYHALELWHG